MADWDMSRDWNRGTEEHPSGRRLSAYAERLDKVGDMLGAFDDMPAALRDWLTERDLDLEELERTFSDVAVELDTLVGCDHDGALFGCEEGACDEPLAPIVAQCDCGALLCRECAEWQASENGAVVCSECAHKAA